MQIIVMNMFCGSVSIALHNMQVPTVSNKYDKQGQPMSFPTPLETTRDLRPNCYGKYHCFLAVSSNDLTSRIPKGITVLCFLQFRKLNKQLSSEPKTIMFLHIT